METERALKEAVKYNAIALVPTAVGVGLAALGLWFGALGALFETLDGSSLEAILAGRAGFTVNGLVIFAGVGLGYVIHRLGRTTLLFKLYGDVLLEELGAAETREVPTEPRDGEETPHVDET